MKKPMSLAGACLLLCALHSAFGQSCQPFRVLVFSKTAGFRHGAQITAGAALIQSLGSANSFAVDHTEDASLINPVNLAQYAAVIFLHTTGDILTPAQESAFESYIRGGGGFAGMHSAADTEYGWPFYGALVGAYFASHPSNQAARVTVTDPSHPSTASLPASFTHVDEWYNFQSNVSTNPAVDVLLTIDESTYVGGTMGTPHPIAWCQEVPGVGRSWYTALGHTLETYPAPFFHDHLLGGILWAAGSIRTATICGGQTYGSSSGSPAISLDASFLSPTTLGVSLSGGTPSASFVIGTSPCSTTLSMGSLTLLVDVAAPGFEVHGPFVFDAAGRWQVSIPRALQFPGSAGSAIFIQGVQVASAIGLSNGYRLSLCP